MTILTRVARSADGLCCALAAKKGFLQCRSGAADPHRAGLLIVRDTAEGALLLTSRPPCQAESADADESVRGRKDEGHIRGHDAGSRVTSGGVETMLGVEVV